MSLSFNINEHTLNLHLSGDFIDFNQDTTVDNLLQNITTSKIRIINIEASALKQWDSTLLVILFNLYQIAHKQQINIKTQKLPDNLQQLINLALSVDRKPSLPQANKLPFFEDIGNKTINLWNDICKSLSFIKEVSQSFGKLFTNTAVMRKIDWLFALEDCSYKAIGIVSLISFMVGLILAFVGAIQLKNFGAQIYVASLVAIGMIRIMGAIMVGVVMAGRTGASYAATIGTMQVNEEIDALKTMGIPVTDFLVLPRITALIITMPILTILADIMGILGGASVGIFALNIPMEEYIKYTQNALSVSNFMVGIFHGLVFGIIISLCGCYYGINCGRNADSVGKSTTQAVVSSIVWMIIATGILTLIFEALEI
ncbi:MAG: ABC transporter permease [Alphaproteobacteria bacterium]|nr:ABC transporter permease [Alphaproteobacteria bacterium]